MPLQTTGSAHALNGFGQPIISFVTRRSKLGMAIAVLLLWIMARGRRISDLSFCPSIARLWTRVPLLPRLSTATLRRARGALSQCRSARKRDCAARGYVIMNPIVHATLGVHIANLGFRQRYSRRAAVILAAASVFPDIDSVTLFISREAYAHYHRAFTHSLGGWLI